MSLWTVDQLRGALEEVEALRERLRLRAGAHDLADEMTYSANREQGYVVTHGLVPRDLADGDLRERAGACLEILLALLRSTLERLEKEVSR